MNIEIKQELVAKLNQSLDLGRFKTIEELVEYLLNQYISLHDNGDDLCELIESYNDTHKEINTISIIDDDLDISTYEVDEDNSDEYDY